jgi:hypothetical protein
MNTILYMDSLVNTSLSGSIGIGEGKCGEVREEDQRHRTPLRWLTRIRIKWIDSRVQNCRVHYSIRFSYMAIPLEQNIYQDQKTKCIDLPWQPMNGRYSNTILINCISNRSLDSEEKYGKLLS